MWVSFNPSGFLHYSYATALSYTVLRPKKLIPLEPSITARKESSSRIRSWELRNLAADLLLENWLIKKIIEEMFAGEKNIDGPVQLTFGGDSEGTWARNQLVKIPKRPYFSQGNDCTKVWPEALTIGLLYTPQIVIGNFIYTCKMIQNLSNKLTLSRFLNMTMLERPHKT